MTDDEVMAEWNTLRARAEEMAKAAAADPDAAREQGLHIPLPPGMRANIIDTARGDASYLRRGGEPPEPLYTQYLRAAAKKVIPEDTGFAWEVVTTIGGGAYLMLKGHHVVEEA